VTPESHGDAARAIEFAFKRLLTEKHLYQSVDVDVTFLAKAAELEEKRIRRPITTNNPPTIDLTQPAVRALMIVTGEFSRYWAVLEMKA
jgi:hypothetical protein